MPRPRFCGNVNLPGKLPERLPPVGEAFPPPPKKNNPCSRSLGEQGFCVIYSSSAKLPSALACSMTLLSSIWGRVS